MSVVKELVEILPYQKIVYHYGKNLVKCDPGIRRAAYQAQMECRAYLLQEKIPDVGFDRVGREISRNQYKYFAIGREDKTKTKYEKVIDLLTKSRAEKEKQ